MQTIDSLYMNRQQYVSSVSVLGEEDACMKSCLFGNCYVDYIMGVAFVAAMRGFSIGKLE